MKTLTEWCMIICQLIGGWHLADKRWDVAAMCFAISACCKLDVMKMEAKKQ